MAAQILPFPKPSPAPSSPIATYLWVGEAHRKLADLHAAGHLPARRLVVEASRLRNQRELTAAVRDAGGEIVLDTEAAELASVGRHAGRVRGAPWALPEGAGPLGPDHFRADAKTDVIGQIARLAVSSGVTAVLSPAHHLGDPAFHDWFSVDRDACPALRRALDREGGQGIAIDYPLIVPNAMLNDQNHRGLLVAALAALPIDYVWLRVVGLGADAGPLQLSRYLSAVAGLHNLGKPVIADHLGGLPGQAAVAFGGVSGIAQGIGERERFDTGDWHKPAKPRPDDAKFGRAVRLSIPGLNRTLTRSELDVLASAKNGRRICGCADRACCKHGYDSMVTDPRGHAARQFFNSIAKLEAVPDLRRETYFLSHDGPMAKADRTAREIKALRPDAAEAARHNVDPEALMKRLADHSRTTEKICTTLETIHETRGNDVPRARVAALRSGGAPKSAKGQP
ncbi:hypothetical protein ACFQY5_21840 [Paeniroseomonas aquatica]|uniref:hypothetical protein n=1 Tax=Paeniroseomonas aquatica TaxID=373043 RepID=UPI0036191A1B